MTKEKRYLFLLVGTTNNDKQMAEGDYGVQNIIFSHSIICKQSAIHFL